MSSTKKKRTGKARWGRNDTELCYKYFNGDGKKRINHKKLKESADYCKEIQDLEDLWQRHPKKNFDQQIRKYSQVWLAEQEQRNARRGKKYGTDSSDEDDDDDDDDEYTDSKTDDSAMDTDDDNDGNQCKCCWLYFSV